MQRNFLWVYHSFLALLCAVILWSVWRATAQSSNQSASPAPSAAPTSTNHPSGSVNGADAALTETAETPQWVESLAVELPFLKWQWWGNEMWKYLFSLVYIFLAFYVSKLLDHLTRVWLKKWTERTETKFDDLFLDLLNGPIKVVAFIIFLRIGLDVFKWPNVVQKFLAKGFTIIVAISLTYMVLKFIDLVMGYWRQRTRPDDRAFDQQLFPIIRKSLKVFIIVVAALVTLDNLGVNITAAIASLSIGGLAVGLAA